MENEMVLLQKGFATLGADMGPECAASVWMTFVMQNQTVLRHEALSAELTEVCLRFLLRRRSDLYDLLNLLCLLLILLCNLNRRLLYNLLLDLSLLLGLCLSLLVNLNLLMLLISVRWTLENLIDHFSVRGNDLNWHW